MLPTLSQPAPFDIPIGARDCDRAIVATNLLAWLAAIAIGVQQEQPTLALLLGGALWASSLLVLIVAPGTLLSRLVLTAALAALVALHIQLGRGRTEFHFGVFVSLGILLVYLDWRPIVFAAGLFAVHHIAFDRLQAAGMGVYCVSTASFPTVVLHACYLLTQVLTEVGAVTVMGRVAIRASTTSRELGVTLERVQGTVRSTRRGAMCIEAAAGDIARGNADLRNRTDETANQLQEATASLERLTTSVRTGADSAAAANRLANTTADVAAQGSGLVREVVAKMDDISVSSHRIGDIIGVIDSIAFQTNILALNAAVEAARAGEQGRGFAVVASEVRSLSRRSSDSAREIKQLIQASVADVESGGRLVREAGTKIDDIVTGVGSVARLVEAISRTTVEQSAGIATVSQTVTEIDRMTRQNTTLVHRSGEAADSLRAQASRLLEVAD